MAESAPPLIRFLREPQSSVRFQRSDWEDLLRSARRGQLLARVARVAAMAGLTGKLPDKVNPHFQSALQIAQSHARSVAWETRQLRDALAGVEIPFVLLKGAAYIAANLEAGHGRLMSDIDIMVQRSALEPAEKSLIEHGWFPTKLDAYDQRYYRTWMHELPPLQHLERGTSLDVHHTILPPTASLKPDMEKLWQASLPAAGDPLVRVFAPVDMILHSAVHLFHDGDMRHGLRDLVDIDALIKQFSGTVGFWETFVQRAIEMDLTRPCHYALKYCRLWLATPIPDRVTAAVRQSGAPAAFAGGIMDRLLPASLGAVLEPDPGPRARLADFLMYVRSHYLRMPMHLLIPHLLRKRFARDER
ncbi:MAG: nucleotidyltransferase family protein [Sulfuritalea sp.]|nr:nucleotidyltransferase family protein [Sulfuritalea sp.]